MWELKVEIPEIPENPEKQKNILKKTLTMKKIHFIAIAAILLSMAACDRPYDTVFSTWPNGGKKLVFTVVDKNDGTVERLAEKMFYENGKPMYEKHFNGDRPTGEWTFWYDNGNIHAQGNFDKNDSIGSGWTFFDKDGANLFEGEYDSMAVLQFTVDHRPLSVCYYVGNSEMRYQFNENYTLNGKGRVVNGKKEGRWEFYYANGQKMLEATYSDGIENGAYNSYRETGIPYFRGFYINGQRANIWEIYDEAGNLVDRKDFDEH